MGSKFSMAETVETIANTLIPNYHPHLAGARMCFIHTEKASKKGGRIVAGSVKRAGGLVEFLAEKDFVITIGLDMWNSMTAAQRTAEVDHLLECCVGEEDEETGDMIWSVREPEVREFASILLRHGVWNDSLANFVSVAQQIDLDSVISQETAAGITDLNDEEEEEKDEIGQTH